MQQSKWSDQQSKSCRMLQYAFTVPYVSFNSLLCMKLPILLWKFEETKRQGRLGKLSYIISNVTKCDVSDIYASHAFHLMVFNTGCPQNLAGDYRQMTLFIFLTETCILELTNILVIVNWNLVVSIYFSLLGKNTMKEQNLTKNTGLLVINDKLKRDRTIHFC